MVECHSIARRLPPRERRNIRDQIERSSSSISRNIAEGHGRSRPREFLRYIDIACGELRETQTSLIAVVRLGYVTEAEANTATVLVESLAKMLHALRKSIIRRHNLE